MVSFLETTAVDFIDYALFIVGIMLLYYLARFLFFGEGKEDDTEERKKKVWDFVDRKKKESQTKKEFQERERKARYPKSFLVKAVDDCDDLLDALRDKDRKEASHKAHSEWNKLKDHLLNAARYLRNLRRGEKGDVYAYLENLVTYGGEAYQLAKETDIPKHDSGNWVNEVQAAMANAKKIKEICGALLKSIDNFVEKAELQTLNMKVAAARAGTTAAAAAAGAGAHPAGGGAAGGAAHPAAGGAAGGAGGGAAAPKKVTGAKLAGIARKKP